MHGGHCLCHRWCPSKLSDSTRTCLQQAEQYTQNKSARSIQCSPSSRFTCSLKKLWFLPEHFPKKLSRKFSLLGRWPESPLPILRLSHSLLFDIAVLWSIFFLQALACSKAFFCNTPSPSLEKDFEKSLSPLCLHCTDWSLLRGEQQPCVLCCLG